MNSLYTHLSVILFVLLLISCKDKKEQDDVPVLQAKYNPSLNDSLVCNARELFEEPQVVFLDYTSESLLNSDMIQPIMIHRDKIFIMEKSQNALIVFDMKGHHLYSLFPSGRGPGEFLAPVSFAIDRNKNEVILFCDRPNKLMFFGADDGKFIAEADCKGRYASEIVLDHAGQLLTQNTPSDSAHYISVVNIDDHKINSVVGVDMPFYHGRFTFGTSLTKGEHVHISKIHDNHIYTWDGENLTKRYRLDFGKYNFPDNLKKANVDQKEFDYQVFTNRVIFSMTNIKETPGLIYFRTNNSGFFVIDKTSDSVRFYSSFYEPKYRLYNTELISIEDPDNKMFGMLYPMDMAKRLLTNIPANRTELPAEFVHKIDSLPEDANPVLLLYKSKK